MRRHSKTKLEKATERAEAEASCREQFLSKLKATKTLAGAAKLVSEAPFPDQPGRNYYTNLAFFLENLRPPGGADATELSLYIELIQTEDSLEKLEPKVRIEAKEALMQVK